MITPDRHDQLIGYITEGYMPIEVALAIVDDDAETRVGYAKQLLELADTGLEEGEDRRLSWLVRKLGGETLDQTVFVETVANKPPIGPKHGLMFVEGLAGRHSTPHLNAVLPSTN